MRTHVSSHPVVSTVRGGQPSLAGVLRFLDDRFLWLPIGALVAVIWANLDPDRYFTLAHRLAFPVIDVGLALFLASPASAYITGQEIVIDGGWGLGLAD